MIFVLAGFILGSVLGSFIKVLADRSLSNRSFWGRSYCPNCKKNLRWYDLFPIFSYISTLGKCRYCKKKIGIEYPLVEIVMGILVGYLFFLYSANFNFLITEFSSNFKFQIVNLVKSTNFLLGLVLRVFFICILAVVFITDIKKMFIPDRVIIPAIKIGFLYLLAVTLFDIGYLYYILSQTPVGQNLLPPNSPYFYRHAVMIVEPFLYSILSGIVIGGFFLSLIIITRGKGMGGGDVKLGAFMGLMLGFPQSLVALMIAFISGAIFSIILIIFGKKRFGQVIPFGPFLVLGSLIALFFGNQILNWYLYLSFK